MSGIAAHSDFNDKARPPPGGPQKELTRMISGLARSHDTWQIFSDFVEAGAICITNAVDWPQREAREQRYLEIVKRYRAEELAKFPEMLAMLTEALEEAYDDVLGRTFHDLELHNKYKGQYFTPYEVGKMMATMTLGDASDVQSKIAERGFVRAAEPGSGSGAMIIALAEGMRDLGVNYQQHLHVTAVDIDPKCVHMTYLQLSLLHIPALVIHGNSLSLEEFSHWHTPAHIMGGWTWKLRRAPTGTQGVEQVPDIEIPAPLGDAAARSPAGPAVQLTLF